MAEFTGQGSGDAVLWDRSTGQNAQGLDVVEILSPALRSDLGAWNLLFNMTASNGFEFASEQTELQHRVDAFLLSARVQRELGTNTMVFCTSGAGDTFFGEGGRHPTPGGWYPRILLRTAETGSDLFDWAPRAKFVVTAEQANLSARTAQKVSDWRKQTRVAISEEGSGGPAHRDARAVGLEVSALIQADIGIGARALFFGGESPACS